MLPLSRRARVGGCNEQTQKEMFARLKRPMLRQLVAPYPSELTLNPAKTMLKTEVALALHAGEGVHIRLVEDFFGAFRRERCPSRSKIHIDRPGNRGQSRPEDSSRG